MDSPPCPITDCHIHYAHPRLMPELLELCDEAGIGKFNIVCTPDQKRLSLTPDALHLKANYPDRVYVFGGLDISPLFVEPDRAGEIFADYAEKLIHLGCDGIKMIEGKPQIRKMIPVLPFDSEVMEPYWTRLEETQIPVLFHLNDPEEFWNIDKVPGWAKERGWYYGDGSFINNEVQYSEVLTVLSRHPRLKIVFAHFMFLSAQLPRLAKYLDEYPNISIDITPGIEMYFNFSANWQESRQFFETYQDRIMFGTDVGAKALLESPDEGLDFVESEERIVLVRRFLEEGDSYTLESDGGFLFGESESQLKPLFLPLDILEKIYHKNFDRFVGGAPRALDRAAIAEECDRLADTVDFMGAIQPDLDSDNSIAKEMARFFRT